MNSGDPLKKPSSGQTWSDLETSHLIATYEEKWYSLRRCPFKAHQWDEVAAVLASRCGLAPRTGTQCRHKMEKLRKRYRAERKAGGVSSWIHYARMDQMENGPMPISVRPPGTSKGGILEEEEEGGDSEEEESEEVEEEVGIRRPERVQNWRFGRSSERGRAEEETDEMAEASKKLASVMRRFGEGFSRIEKRRMELMRDMERDWMEMEAKREEMFIESGRYIVDAISRAFHSAKKAKRSSEI